MILFLAHFALCGGRDAGAFCVRTPGLGDGRLCTLRHDVSRGGAASEPKATRACATRVQVPEIPILDSPAFKAAKREPEQRPPVEYVEVPKPLPLPGQLKPVPNAEKQKDERSPKERIIGGRRADRVRPWCGASLCANPDGNWM